MTDAINAVSNVGFPIVCTFILFYFYREMVNMFNSNMLELTQTLRGLTDAVDTLREEVQEAHKEV